MNSVILEEVAIYPLTERQISMKKIKNNPQQNISRRDFMKAASAFTAGGMLLGSLPIGASAYAGASDELKLAIVGCGNRGTGAVANALDAADGVKLVAMADIYEDRLNSSYNILSQRFANSDKLDLSEENRMVGFEAYKDAISMADVVILTTPTFWRPLHPVPVKLPVLLAFPFRMYCCLP